MAAGFSSQLQPTYIGKVILSFEMLQQFDCSQLNITNFDVSSNQCIYLLSAFDLYIFCKKKRVVAFHKQAHQESFNDCEMRGNENIKNICIDS